MSAPYDPKIDPYLNQLNEEARNAGINYKSLALTKTISHSNFEKYSEPSRKAGLLVSETETMIIFNHGNDFSIYYKRDDYWIHAFTSNLQII